MEQLYPLFSLLLIFSVSMVIISTNPIHSIFWLVLTFIYSACFILVLKFDFISLMLIIIYVGAITILFLFVIMMVDTLQLRKIVKIENIIPLVFIIFLNMFISSWWLVKSNRFNEKSFSLEWDLEYISYINNLSLNLYVNYWFSLLVISLLLLIAMIGAIILTLETSLITRKQNLSKQHQRNNSWT
uniref:NADH-ubiquinone oxidoreductase chain 6 n=1 Tax=Turritopsis dohrnii TaxID=308579 RepID=A0A1B0TFV8_9CNID|nr:NADH dehydrogenase subunit 6 [Turritopsis dohrnii]ALK27155.1 NADH dehydrogenase subunit 6 [Turritopsis dohrnii]